MRILIVTPHFYPETFRINDLALDLKNNGHQVTVVTAIPDYPGGKFFEGYGLIKKRRENYHGIEIIRIPLIARGQGGNLRLFLNYFSFAVMGMLLAPFVCRGKFDVIFVFEPSPITVGLPALVLKAIKRVPILFWVQDLWPESLSAVGAVHSKRILTWVGHLVKFIYYHCDRILVQSKAFIPSIEKRGVPREKIRYFPNAAEDIYSEISADHIIEGEGLPAGFRIVYAGNIGVAQSFETILAAALELKAYPDIQWIVIGDGRQKTWLAEQIIRLGLANTIHLFERKPIEHMPYYLGLADALLVTLKRDPVFALTIPSKVQSYLACGKPILASLDGEAAYIVEESGAGLVSPAEDAKALARNVLAMYNADPSERQKQGERGRGYFKQHFEKQRLLVQLQNWMIEVTGEQ